MCRSRVTGVSLSWARISSRWVLSSETAAKATGRFAILTNPGIAEMQSFSCQWDCRYFCPSYGPTCPGRRRERGDSGRYPGWIAQGEILTATRRVLGVALPPSRTEPADDPIHEVGDGRAESPGGCSATDGLGSPYSADTLVVTAGKATLPMGAQVLVEAHRFDLEKADAADRHAEIAVVEREFKERSRREDREFGHLLGEPSGAARRATGRMSTAGGKLESCGEAVLRARALLNGMDPGALAEHPRAVTTEKYLDAKRRLRQLQEPARELRQLREERPCGNHGRRPPLEAVRVHEFEIEHNLEGVEGSGRGLEVW